MTTLRLVLGDQLSTDLTALADIDLVNDVVLMAEVEEECRYVPCDARTGQRGLGEGKGPTSRDADPSLVSTNAWA